jgi:hypothetical protein
MGSEGDSGEVSERRMRMVWLAGEAWITPQGRESDEQLTEKLTHILSHLPHEMALGEREANAEAIGQMRGMRSSCEAAGFLRNPQQPLSEAWVALSDRQREYALLSGIKGQWVSEWPDVPRVAVGVKRRVDRLRSLGNAVVPQIVEIIGRAIMEADQ